jgi:PEP-CTERM motif
MFKNIYTVALVVTLLSFTGSAKAVVTDIHWTPVDGDPTVPNSVQNTLFTSMSADWTNAVVSIFLTEGSLLNPTPTGATSEWEQLGGANDTWLAVPSNAAGGFPTINLFDQDSPVVAGVDHTFDWFDTADNPAAISNGIAARIYASDTAMGTFKVQMFDRDSAGVPAQLSGLISNGSFVTATVPEPATLTLLGLTTAAGLLGFRRRRTR